MVWRGKEKITEVFPLWGPDPPPGVAKARTVQESLISTSTLIREREVTDWREKAQREWEAKMAAQRMTP